MKKFFSMMLVLLMVLAALVGCGGNNTADVIAQAKEYAKNDKIAALLSVAPFYNKPNQRGVYAHFKALADNVDKPILLYNVPGRTGINISPDKVTFGMEKRDNKIGCLTAVYDTCRLGRKFLMPSIRKRQDWGLFLNILKECGVCYAITEPLAVYRNRTGSISSRKFPLVKYNVRIYHDILGYSWPQSLFYLLFFFLPTYGTKVLKRKVDSYRLMKQIKQGKKPF